MRIDKVLWYLRFARTRTVAQSMAEDGHIRVNGRRIERSHQKISVGDVLTLPIGQHVRVIEVLTLPQRRGPAHEAQACYRVLDGSAANPLAAASIAILEKGNMQP